MAKYQSRAARLSTIGNHVTDAKVEVEELRDELQNWLDNLPENLQSSNKASMLEEAISNLDTIISDLESIDWNVDFPGMFD